MHFEAIEATCYLIAQITVRDGWHPDNRKFTQMRVRQRMEELMSILEIDMVVANKRLLLSPESVNTDSVKHAVRSLVYMQQKFAGLMDTDIEPILAVVLQNLGIAKAGPVEL